MRYCVVQITDAGSGKSYIAITTNPVRYWRYLRSRESQSLISRAIAEQGSNSFSCQTLHRTHNHDDAAAYAAHLIRELRTLAPHGYNESIPHAPDGWGLDGEHDDHAIISNPHLADAIASDTCLELSASGMTPIELAVMYGVSPAHITTLLEKATQ